LAEPGDFDPPEPKYVLDFGTMSLKATGEEAERLRKEDEEREQAAKARQERQRQEAEAIAEVRERWAEQAAPTNVAGWEVRPNGKVVSFDDR
jgi:hypothetical protein